MATVNDLKEIAEWTKSIKEALPPDPPKPVNKGGRPKAHKTQLAELDLATRLSRAQSKLEELLDSDDVSGAKRLACQALVESLTSQWEREQDALAKNEDRKYAASQSSDKGVSDGLKSLGVTLDDVREFVSTRDRLMAQVRKLSEKLSSSQTEGVDNARLSKDLKDGFAVVSSFMLRATDEAREHLGMLLILTLVHRANPLLESLKLSTWTGMVIKTVPELTEFLAAHPDAVGEIGERAAYCRWRLRLEHKLDPAKLVEEFLRKQDEDRERRLRQREHEEFLAQRQSQEELRKQWVKRGAEADLKALDQRERISSGPREPVQIIEYIPINK